MMKFPALKFLANVDAHIEVNDGTDENGAPNVVDEFVVGCRFEQSNSVVHTKEGTKVTLRAKVFIFEGFEKCPNEMTGFCTVDKVKYDVANVSKKRNPDGSIQHIVLELM